MVDTAGEIFGDVPNVAARAQALAEPGAVAVTRGCTGRSPACSSPRSRAARPERRTVRASGAGRGGGQQRLTPLVGRDDEIAMLMRRAGGARRAGEKHRRHQPEPTTEGDLHGEIGHQGLVPEVRERFGLKATRKLPLRARGNE